MKKLSFLVIALLLGASKSQALEYGCTIKPEDINKTATRFLKRYVKAKTSFPNSEELSPGFVDGELSTVDDDNSITGSVEGFYRPEQDKIFTFLPFPFFGFQLSRDSDVIYLCAHKDKDPAKTHVTLYFLRGNHLDPKTDFSSPSGIINSLLPMRIGIEPIVLIPIMIDGNAKSHLQAVLSQIPFFKFAENTINDLETFITGTVQDFTKVGVERITITTTYAELASGVNLKHPAESLYQSRFEFNQGDDSSDDNDDVPTAPPVQKPTKPLVTTP